MGLILNRAKSWLGELWGLCHLGQILADAKHKVKG